MEKTWFAVDGHGREYAFDKKCPRRDFPNLDLRVKWGQRWISGVDDKGVMLPKGSIEIMIGRKLTYADDPVLVEYDDYGNYTETRPDVLNAEPDNWPNY